MSTNSHEVLEEAFSLVQNPDDWRAPIDATVEASDDRLDQIIESVVFFTGTYPDVEALGGGKYRVVSIGYRNGPCGP